MKDQFIWIISNESQPNEDSWYEETWEEAIKEGNRSNALGDICPFYITKGKLVDPTEFVGGIFMFDSQLIWDNFLDNIEETDPDWWPKPTSEQLSDLQSKFESTMIEWLERYNIRPRQWEGTIGEPIKVLPGENPQEPEMESK